MIAKRQPPPIQIEGAEPIHCWRCGRFLGLERIVDGVVQLKCSACKEWTTIGQTLELDEEPEAVYSGERKATKVP